MYNFNGISKKAINLLAENRFHDSKNFYEEHKQELKELATVPMRKIMIDLSETLTTIDDEIDVNPVYCVSRIRRDTRLSKNKLMYRENLWIMFRRNKKLYQNCPCMWFEFFPDSYNIGVGLFTVKPSQMEFYRRAIRENPDEFNKVIKAAKKAKLNFVSDCYKKQRTGCPSAKFETYYNAKSAMFMRTCFDLSKISDETLIDELKEFMETVKPIYDFMLKIHKTIVAEENY